ncbi:small subunit ribosomal protein S9 [Hydrogenivirga caldilitoris]|uniref:30S ribosomal protein S9 n=1 Tax=Hydrogenivirga caldilitoris TaxID=246264 RepID=A0A497XTM6_9AQUI|nr:30S ribosomal protein S9 [Hydrogenivirga caldilitoris]RLJ71439.1 small subunit ribosomal protein S9 [Hydrogenivirga caldilitoris]
MKLKDFKITPENSHYGTGRRKESIARVWILKDQPNKFIVRVDETGKEYDLRDYVQRETLFQKVMLPFKATGTEGKFGIYATVEGGGISGQAEAIMYGVAKALLAHNSDFRTPLKKAKLLARDAREKERKKYAQMGARAKYRWSKR